MLNLLAGSKTRSLQHRLWQRESVTNTGGSEQVFFPPLLIPPNPLLSSKFALQRLNQVLSLFQFSMARTKVRTSIHNPSTTLYTSPSSLVVVVVARGVVLQHLLTCSVPFAHLFANLTPSYAHHGHLVFVLLNSRCVDDVLAPFGAVSSVFLILRQSPSGDDSICFRC